LSWFRRCPTLHALLVLTLLAGLWTGPVAAADSSHPFVYDVADNVHEHAGGWGLKSALIFSASGAVREFYDARNGGRTYSLGNAMSFTKQPRFWGGLIGDLSLTMAVTAIAPAIPGGIFVQTFAKVAAGFVGFELGSGNIKNTDWLSIGAQAAVSTAVYLGAMAALGPMGIAFAPVIATVLSIGAALATAYLLDKLRGPKHVGAERPTETASDTTFGGTTGPSIFGSPAVSGGQTSYGAVNDGSLERRQADRKAAYVEFVAASQRGDRQAMAEAMQRMRAIDGQLTQSRVGAAGAR